MASLSKMNENCWRAQVFVRGVRDSATFRTKREAEAWGSAREFKLRAEADSRKELARKLGIKPGSESNHAILNNQTPVPNVPGIYILFLDGAVSYVGKSTNMLSRIASHAEKGRKFTHYHAIPCFPDELDDKEAYYIELLDPPENKALAVGNRQRRKAA